MRKLLFAAGLVAALLASTSCDKEPASSTFTLTFEECDYKGVSSRHSYWNSMIDSKEYGGWLYTLDPYNWSDELNTYLTGSSKADDWGSWGVSWSWGHVISDYTVTEGTPADYTRQLSVIGEQGHGGHNGSKNFAIHYG
ncbi:MAG: hypothetical protein HUJ94_04730, partial [Bacteroidales bacterium]|nr:hypothetical protein [Bacteroidales bacterium]